MRSDTVTRPTPGMRKAMFEAQVGDDVHGDDPTVNKLEEMAALKLGMEAALFVPSGTMGNTIALKLGCGEGNIALIEENCHIMNFECGNISRIAASLPRPLPSDRGEISLKVLKSHLDNPLKEHIPATRFISLENTHNTWGGTVLNLEYIKEVKKLAQEYNLHFHLDGARVFNASTALNIDVKEITTNFDSVMFCLSKGLGAPIGSMLGGRSDFIKRARKVRKYLGGGMRQVGIIAAAGIFALDHMVNRLAEDHGRAKKLALALGEIKQISIDLDRVETNFVLVNLKTMSSLEYLNKLKAKKVLALPLTNSCVRIVTHNDIDDKDIEIAINANREIFS